MTVCKKHILSYILILLIVLTVAFIWGNSMLDGESSAELSNGLLDKLRPYLALAGISPEDDIWLRKLAHFCEFSLLGFELCLLFVLREKQGRAAFASASVSALVVAAVDEGIQMFSGRYSHILDVLLDFCGAVCGAAVLLVILHLWNRHKE